MNKRKILVVDDSKINRRILHKLLSDSYDVIEAEDGKIALEKLYENKENISAVLLDIIMPVMDGYEFLDHVKSNKEISKIPIIVTTQQEGEESEIKALSHGASDFITKPYNPQIIIHRISNIVTLRENSTKIKTLQRDPLTDLYNRQAFIEKTTEILNNNPNNNYDIVSLDIERFKLVNDLYGSEEGDNLLIAVGKKLRETVREYKTVSSRFSGDVFVALFPADKDKEKQLSESFIQYFSDYHLDIKVDIKIGVYPIRDKSMPIYLMFDRSRIAANSIKGIYDAHLAYYDENIREKMLFEQQITSSMKKSLLSGQFQVYYQPKFDLMNNEIVGAEALIRWHHPELGDISPEVFVPIFEKNGFITQIDTFVCNEVCKQIRYWIDKGNVPFPISINISRIDIYNPNLVSILTGTVEKYGIEVRLLHLEITETAYTENAKQLISVVKELKNLGFTIEMDDFGKGYSSLNMISEVPVDTLKLDMKFLQNHTDGGRSGNILNFVINLAKWLGLSVIAEGIETQEHVSFLKSMRCNFGQGYFFSKPLSKADFEELLTVSPICDEKTTFPKVDSIVGIEDIWNPSSDFNKIFGKYAGALAMYQYSDGKLTLLRANDDYMDTMNLPINDGTYSEINLIEEIHPEDREIVVDTVDVALSSKNSFSCEVRRRNFLTKENEYIWVQVKGRIIYRFDDNALVLAIVQNITKEKQLENDLISISQMDSLTGLPNRRLFENKMEMLTGDGKTKVGSFLILDIDSFKKINDTNGHHFGDTVLKEVANILSETASIGDCLARIGGDEFVVFIPDVVDQASIFSRADHICKSVSSLNSGVTCSIGVAMYPEHANTLEKIYEKADLAMYQAKNGGKNRVCIYNSEQTKL